MNHKEILGTTIAQLEKLVSEARASAPAPTDKLDHVVVKGRTLVGSNFFVLGTLYPDQVPPTGELDGFRMQRMVDLDGVYRFIEADADNMATKFGAQTLTFKLWLELEIEALEKHLNTFRQMEARFDVTIR